MKIIIPLDIIDTVKHGSVFTIILEVVTLPGADLTFQLQLEKSTWKAVVPCRKTCTHHPHCRCCPEDTIDKVGCKIVR